MRIRWRKMSASVITQCVVFPMKEYSHSLRMSHSIRGN